MNLQIGQKAYGKKIGRGPKNLIHLRIAHSVNDEVYAAIKCMRFPMIGIKWKSSAALSEVTCKRCLKKANS